MCGWTGHIQDSEAELLPAAETSEAELGQPSKFTSALRRAMEIWATATISVESVRAALRRVRSSALNFVPRDCEDEARPADETAEAQRKRGAACGRNSRAEVGAAVQIYERATTRDGNLANSNKRGSGLPFASPLRRAQQKQGTATTRGKEFLSRVCGQKWVPPGARRFCDTLKDRLWSLSLSVCLAAGQRRDDRVMRRPILPRWRWRRCGRRSCQSRPTPSNRPTAR